MEGKDAWFVSDKGRYATNWLRAPLRYANYKSRHKNKTKYEKLSNNLRSALLNSYEKEGAKEYFESQKRNDKKEIIERQFQMPPRILKSLFGSDVLLMDDGSEQDTGSIASKVTVYNQDLKLNVDEFRR